METPNTPTSVETRTPDQIKRETIMQEITNKVGFKVDDSVIFNVVLTGGPVQVSREVACLVKSIVPKGSVVVVQFAIENPQYYADEKSRVFECNFFLVGTDEYDLRAKLVNGKKVIKYDREWSASLRFYA
jgi:hypothetical protein